MFPTGGECGQAEAGDWDEDIPGDLDGDDVFSRSLASLLCTRGRDGGVESSSPASALSLDSLVALALGLLQAFGDLLEGEVPRRCWAWTVETHQRPGGEQHSS